MSVVPLRVTTIACFFSTIAACGGTPSKVAARPAVAVAVLESARVDASVVHRSCSGERFCREDTVDPSDRDTLSDLDEDCARRGGKTAFTRCVRDGAVAACSVNGAGLGGIMVFAYATDAATVVAEHCEALEGTFERL